VSQVILDLFQGLALAPATSLARGPGHARGRLAFLSMATRWTFLLFCRLWLFRLGHNRAKPLVADGNLLAAAPGTGRLAILDAAISQRATHDTGAKHRRHRQAKAAKQRTKRNNPAVHGKVS